MRSDRIFWANDKFGMPLYFYGYLNILREEYDRNRAAHKAYHLFMNDNPEARDRMGRVDGMKQKWDRAMPEPFTRREAGGLAGPDGPNGDVRQATINDGIQHQAQPSMWEE